MSITRRKKNLFVGGGLLLLGYFGLYLLNSVFGGYDPCWTSDGRRRHEAGLLVHDCIMWQPRFGSYYNEYRSDFLGLLFYPLLWSDHRFIHKTHSIFEEDFAQWWESLADADIHPNYRADFQRWKAVASKYEPQLASAKARGDTNEVQRIRKLMREESDNPKTTK